jgi:hypothetical protein
LSLRILPALAGALAAAGLITSAEAQIQTAGELFVDIDATELSPGFLNAIPNSGTLGGFFEARGGGAMVPAVAQIGGTKGIRFDGNDYMQLVDSVGGNLIMAPAGLVGIDPTRTIEVWAFNPAIASEETMVAWGKRGGGPNGSNMSFNYGTHGAFGAVGHWGGADIGWFNAGGAPTAGQWHHLVYTYDGTTTRVYADGVLLNSEVLGSGAINTHANTPINLATQTEGDGVNLNGGLRGSLTMARVRIHDGVLTDEQIADNYNFERSEFIDPSPPVPEPLAAGPAHRYSFDEPATANASGVSFEDSINFADGTVLGEGASLTGSRLVLPGGASSSAAYGDLPNRLLSQFSTNSSGSGAVSIEGWVKVTGGRTWSRIFDFGSTDVGGGVGGELTGPGGGGAGLDYLFYSAQQGANTAIHVLELRNEDPPGGGNFAVNVPSPTFNTDLHFVVTWNEEAGEVTVYENGVERASMFTTAAISDINDVNVWLGRSNWTADQNMQGEFEEFRIYGHVLSANEVLGNFQAGPDAVNLGGPVEIVTHPQDVSAYESYSATFTAGVAGTTPIHFQWLRNGEPIQGATSNTLVLSASTADQGATFSVVVSNFVGGTSHVVTSEAATLTVLTQEVSLKHRYSFDEAPGSLTVEDLAGGAHGEVRGGATFSGDGRLALNGVDGYVNLPNDLVMEFTSITIEAWVIDQGSGNWARIYDFGNSTSGEDFPVGSAGAGTQYMFLTSRSGLGNLRGAYTVTGGGAGEQIVEWPGQPLPPNELKHVVWTSHGPMQTGRLYVDGVLVGSNTAVTLTPADLGPTQNNWLGRAQFNDPRFLGQFEEFRIWDGAMTPAAVQSSFEAGPQAPISGVRLEITSDPSGVITITWPASAADMFLESTTTLGPGAVWLSASEIPELVGDTVRVTVFADGDAKFYRLSR